MESKYNEKGFYFKENETNKTNLENPNAQTVETIKKDAGITDFEQEKENLRLFLKRKSFRIALISTFSAMAIVLGYMLAYIPNIELFTLTIFLSGYILGKRDGIIVGFLSAFIFCFFNPFGASPLPLLTFQMLYYSLTGFLGGLTSIFLKKINFVNHNEDFYKFSVMGIFGAIGAVITTIFQIGSSLIDVLSFFGTLDEFFPYFLTGIPFTITHIIGNTLGFIFILPGLIQLINKLFY